MERGGGFTIQNPRKPRSRTEQEDPFFKKNRAETSVAKEMSSNRSCFYLKNDQKRTQKQSLDQSCDQCINGIQP